MIPPLGFFRARANARRTERDVQAKRTVDRPGRAVCGDARRSGRDGVEGPQRRRAGARAGPVALGSYLGTGHFWEATGENWESEFLQMALFVILTTFLYQKGSAESKRVDTIEEPRSRSPAIRQIAGRARAGAARRLGSPPLQELAGNRLRPAVPDLVRDARIGGVHEYNSEQAAHGQPQASSPST